MVKDPFFPECLDRRPTISAVAATSQNGCDPQQWGLQAFVWEGSGNFRLVFLKTKQLVFGRIPHAQRYGGDPVSSLISQLAYLC